MLKDEKAKLTAVLITIIIMLLFIFGGTSALMYIGTISFNKESPFFLKKYI